MTLQELEALRARAEMLWTAWKQLKQVEEQAASAWSHVHQAVRYEEEKNRLRAEILQELTEPKVAL